MFDASVLKNNLIQRRNMQSESVKSCPQCRDLIQEAAKRIIKDSCGHEKCRVCLLLDVEGCRQCLENENNKCPEDAENLNFETLSEENHYTTVITYNNVYNNVQKGLISPIEATANNFSSNINEIPQEIRENSKTSSKPISSKASSHRKVKSLAMKRNYGVISIPSHISVEGKPPIFMCKICNAKFQTKDHVKYHKFCLEGKKPYVCDICNKSFILKSQLHVHNIIHTGNRPHMCIICNKAFREIGKLKRHMILHCDERPHVCDECGKSFKTLNSLKLHRIIHTGEKPFSCKYCRMKFNNCSNLKKHMVSHSDDKTHMCEQCGKKFKQKWALTVHRKSHLHMRNFVCKECERAFINNKDLKRHESIHLETKMYSCGLCSVSFRRKDNLGRHIKNAHPDKKAEIIRNMELSEKNQKPVVDNPNAINVITASPMAKRTDKSVNKSVPLTRTCINGPLKLAFKTTAFKRNYNINRECNFDSNSKGECHSHLNKSIKNNQSEDMVKTSSLEFVQPQQNSSPSIFPSVYSSPNLSVDEFYANRPHVIKNIKFKIPENYPSKNESLLKTIIPPTQIVTVTKESDVVDVNKLIFERVPNSNLFTKNSDGNISNQVYQKLKTTPVAATSVIVNSSDSRNMHWRRRMSQNVASGKEKF